jgi:tetratricopeptide (TPR) repeat protein
MFPGPDGPGPAAEPADRVLRRARAAHQRGQLAGNTGHPAVAVRHLRAGLVLLGWGPDDEPPDDEPPGAALPAGHRALAARLLMTLAACEAEQSRTAEGLLLLDQAERFVPAQDRGVLFSQRGLLLMRAWRSTDALAALDEAVAALDGLPEAAPALATTLLNRSFCYLTAGDVRRARADLRRCQRVAARAGQDLIAGKALHNLGYCELLAGDIPAALQLFTAAAGVYQEHAPDNLPVLAMDKARALLAAGLAQDAARELDGAIDAFRRQRLGQDHAEAELARAQAAMAAGDLPAARRWAAAARRRFGRRGNDACAGLAELLELRARPLAPGRASAQPGRIAGEAQALARRLRDCGLSSDGDLAELLAARALLAAGRPDEARQRIAGVRSSGGAAAPLDVSLLRRLALAELAAADARPGAALAQLRAGLAAVHARRGRLGSIDLQTATAALGADLAAAGLRLALHRGSAPLAFAWLERSRAQAFRVTPVRPPADDRATAALAELRHLSYLIRGAELAGQRDPAAVARRAQLQRELREHSWEASGPGQPGGRGHDGQLTEAAGQAGLGEVSAALAASGQSLLCILARDGRMHALVLHDGRARLVSLGNFEVAAEAARRLSADLDTLAGRRLPDRLRAVIEQSIRYQGEVLTAEIIAPVRSSLGDGGVVLVPAGPLAAVPWGLLPDLRGRPVTVCPSASSWLAAWRRGQAAADQPAPGPPVLIAGPDLAHAEREVTGIAAIYPGSRPLLAQTATVSGALAALDGAGLAHLAAHGHHDRENVLFSRLDLADGPLMAYDIQQLGAAPQHVVLSACDVGRTLVRPGEEILGFTAALLYVGTSTVIASVTRVADDAAVGVMTSYHRALRAGARPAEALAGATQAEPLSPFVCFGSG